MLLRIEASDDREGDSDLAAVGAGPGIVHSGAVAGFPMPPLRYIVGSPTSDVIIGSQSGQLALLQPDENAAIPLDQPLDFR